MPSWAIFPDLLIRLRADERVIDARFLTAALRSKRSHRALRARAKGLAGSMPKIDQGSVAALSVPAPNLEQQGCALGRLAEVEAAAEAITGALSRQMQRAEVLRYAILSAALSDRAIGRRCAEELMA